MSEGTESAQSLLDGFEGMYSDGDADVRCYSRKVVRTRFVHKCPGNFLEALHEIPTGTFAVVERALVDGKWGTVYTCRSCIIAWRNKNFAPPATERTEPQ